MKLQPYNPQIVNPKQFMGRMNPKPQKNLHNSSFSFPYQHGHGPSINLIAPTSQVVERAKEQLSGSAKPKFIKETKRRQKRRQDKLKKKCGKITKRNKTKSKKVKKQLKSKKAVKTVKTVKRKVDQLGY